MTRRPPSERGPHAARRGRPATGARTAEVEAGPAPAAAGRRSRGRPAERPPAPPVVRVLAMLLAFAAMVAFAVVLARLTLETSTASEPLTHNNLRPGASIREYLEQPAFVDTVRQLGGNILLGVPFGVLLPVLAPRARGLLRVVVLTAVVMVVVEVAQGTVITGRAFDIDDVILNAGGALLGSLLLGRRLGRAVHPRRRHFWHRLTRRGRRAA
ncbi:VanZ family protein [Streptomyces sp. 4N509B]|uniref:VanZ family protein n=1 Tax=Streptomyces sp. 4N509B TaxID=3457413 RepID=UPI003FD1419A